MVPIGNPPVKGRQPSVVSSFSDKGKMLELRSEMRLGMDLQLALILKRGILHLHPTFEYQHRDSRHSNGWNSL